MMNAVPPYSIRSSENLIGLVWFTPPSLAGVHQLEAVFDRTVRSYSRRIGFATRLTREAVAGGAPAEVRREINQLLNHFGKRIGGTVVIYEDTGFRATVARTAMATINLLSRPKFASHVHSDALRGCMWLVHCLGADAPTDGKQRLLDLLSTNTTPDESTQYRMGLRA